MAPTPTKPIVALVTGGNKGIGYAIVRQLCQQFGDSGVVYLAARNEKLGLQAVSSLEKEGLLPRYIHLDAQNEDSIKKAREVIEKTHGGLDILVNNAGVSYKPDAPEPFVQQAELTLGINYFGALQVFRTFLPILNDHARVVNLSSRAGNVAWLRDGRFKSRIVSAELTMDELDGIMQDFLAAAREGTHEQRGYGLTEYPTFAPYVVSKLGLTAATRLMQQQVEQTGRKDIVVNSCCPGYVATDMTDQKGLKTIDEGADTAVYLALLPHRSAVGEPSQIPVGQFVAEREVRAWTEGFDLSEILTKKD